MSLLARLFALVLIAVLPAVAVEAWNEVERRREREAELHAAALRYTLDAVGEIGHVLEGVRQTLVTLAAVSAVRALDGPACNRLVAALRTEYPAFLHVAAADREGRLFCSTRALSRTGSVADRPVFRRAIADGGFTVGEYTELQTGAVQVLPSAYPIRDGTGAVIGAVLGSVELQWLAAELVSKLPADTAFALVDREGTILARFPDGPDYVGRKLPSGIAAYSERAGKGSFEAVGLDGVRRIGAIETLSLGATPDLTLGIGLSQPAAFRALDAATRRGVLLTALGLVLAVVSATVAGRLFVVRPVARLIDAARRWREGDPSARARLTGGSEFARLGHAFDEMADAVEARSAALAASEERLRIALEATGAGTWDVDPRTGERHWSARMFELLALPPGTPASRRALLDATHPQDRARIEEAYRRSYTPSDGRFVIEFRTKRGRWLAARGRVLFGADGRPERSVGTLLDITDTKRIEAALFEKSPVALFLIGVQPDGRFVYEEVNPVFCRYTGVTPEMIVGRSPEEVFDESVATLLNGHYGACLRTGRRHEYEISGELPAGFLIRRTILEPIEWDESGRTRRILAAAMDLTEARQLEAALRQAQKIEALGQLTGGVAHDFNNLLTAVLGNLWLLLQNLPEGRDRRLAEHATRAAERGARLTQQLLAFARRQQMTLQPVDLNALVDGMRDLLVRTLGARIAVETDLAPGLWPALADPNQVELVVLNLAINARDAMPEGGPLRISTANVPLASPVLPPELDGAYVMLAVADAGIGMSEEVRARAFEPFFTTKEVGRGSGLGLSMVYGVATQSGGGATLESTPGQGTVVRVFFPRDAGQPRGSETIEGGA
jgi:PAS domain S-box-containing protein